MASSVDLTAIIKARDQTKGAFSSASKGAGGLGKQFAGLALAAGGAVAAFVSFKQLSGAVNTTQELGKEVAKLSRETGLTSKESSHLVFALKQVGMDGDTAGKALGIFAKKVKGLGDAHRAGTTSGKAFAELLKDVGVQALNADGSIQPVSKLLPQLADKFSKMPDGLTKSALAMQLFGKSGKDMTKLLNLGSDGLQEMSDMADKLGVTLTAKNIGQISAYTKAQRAMKQAITGVKLQIGLALMPALTHLMQLFIKHQPEIRAYVAQLIQMAQAFLVKAAPAIKFFADNFKTGLTTIRPVFEYIAKHKPLLIAAIVAIGAAIVLALGPVSTAFIAIGALIFLIGFFRNHWKDVRDKIVAIVHDLRDKLKNTFKDLKTWLAKNWKEIVLAALTILFPPGAGLFALVTNAHGVRDKVVNAFTSIPGKLLLLVKKFFDAAKGLGNAIKNGLLSGLKAAGGMVASLATEVFNALKAVINIGIQKINDIIPNDIGFNVGPKHFGIDIPDNPIPSLAKGAASVPKNMLAMLHRGEMVIPQKIAEVMRRMAKMRGAGFSKGEVASELGPLLMHLKRQMLAIRQKILREQQRLRRDELMSKHPPTLLPHPSKILVPAPVAAPAFAGGGGGGAGVCVEMHFHGPFLGDEFMAHKVARIIEQRLRKVGRLG
jgi:hypothetical protein